ncbi:GNAT family N-acetyltransferase [Luteolibacter yonseiensis]|uniref:GNAT family N-acetyltransferase n=1 Tax=Luteolibacter yonseiensis TaxID=1144680 RepID=A0A934VDD4_9BACT|nr:GNAT family N-acetyltransferase [Luteolibacter yonseiensis]MBK1818030.1 GNAT family N-acetyltransferase [Luteolibacter yonseiensis]
MSVDAPVSHRLRAATRDDLEFQFRLYASTRQEELAAAGFPEAMRESFLGMQFEAQTSHYSLCYPSAEWLIIGSGGEDAGRLILDRAPDHLHIMDIALLPGFRGRGIGTALLRQVLAEAAEKQLPVRLFAFTGERATGLYRRLGFESIMDDGIHTELVWRPAK